MGCGKLPIKTILVNIGKAYLCVQGTFKERRGKISSCFLGTHILKVCPAGRELLSQQVSHEGISIPHPAPSMHVTDAPQMGINLDIESLCPGISSPCMTRFYSFTQHIFIKCLLCPRLWFLEAFFKSYKWVPSSKANLKVLILHHLHFSFLCLWISISAPAVSYRASTFQEMENISFLALAVGGLESPRGIRGWFISLRKLWVYKWVMDLDSHITHVNQLPLFSHQPPGPASQDQIIMCMQVSWGSSTVQTLKAEVWLIAWHLHLLKLSPEVLVLLVHICWETRV